jgi:hypothetical protein
MAQGAGHGGSGHAQVLRDVFDGDQGCGLFRLGGYGKVPCGAEYSDVCRFDANGCIAFFSYSHINESFDV